MDVILHIFGFLMMVLLGFFSAHIVVLGALQFNLIEHLPPDDRLGMFRLAYFGGAGWACIVGTLIGIACFFSKGKIRKWLMMAPALVPAAYSVLALVYFSI